MQYIRKTVETRGRKINKEYNNTKSDIYSQHHYKTGNAMNFKSPTSGYVREIRDYFFLCSI